MARKITKRGGRLKRGRKVRATRRKSCSKGVSITSIVNHMRRETPNLSPHQARVFVKLALAKGLEAGVFAKKNLKWFLRKPARGASAKKPPPTRGKVMMASVLSDYTAHVRHSHAALRRDLLGHLHDVEDFVERKRRRDRSKDWQVLHALEISMMNTLIQKYLHKRHVDRETRLRHLAHYLEQADHAHRH